MLQKLNSLKKIFIQKKTNSFGIILFISFISFVIFLISFNYSWSIDGKVNTERNQQKPIDHNLDNKIIKSLAKYNTAAISPISDTDIKNQANGMFTIIEYGDFTCPISKQQHQILLDLAMQYPKVNLIFRNFPQKFHKYADNESLFIFCLAQNQNILAWDGVNQLFATSQADGIGRQFSQLEEIISTNDNTKACIQNIETKKVLKKQIDRIEEIGINGTPSLVLIKDNQEPMILSGLYSQTEIKSYLGI